MNVARALQRLAYRTDPAVHHVARGDDVDAGGGLHERLLHQHFVGLIVQHVAMLVDQSILAVCRVRIECHVGQYAEFGEALLDGLDRARHQAFGIEGLAPVRGFEWRGDHRKERHHRDSERNALVGDRQQLVDRHAFDTRHRDDGVAPSFAFHDEHRVDEVADGDLVLPHQAAGEVVAAHAPHANGGKLAEDVHQGKSQLVVANGVRYSAA